MASSLENAQRQAEDEPGEASAWLALINASEKDQSIWSERCRTIRKRYLYESSQTARRRKFQLLWSNQEILRPATYAKCPAPVVDDRWRDGDPIAEKAAQLIERTLDVQFDLGDFDHAFKLIRNDYLLFGRGVPRIRYEADVEEDEELADDDEGSADKDAQNTGPAAVVKAERIVLDFVHREDFIHPKARNWRELPWCAYRSFLSKSEWEKRFPKTAMPLDTDEGTKGDGADSADDKATVYEIWDKVSRKVIWVAKGCLEILEKDDPYLQFEGFWASPRPAYGTLDTQSLTPVPDYVFYQDQAEEIDDLTARIGALTDSLKLVGFYAAGPEGEGSPEIERAVQPGFENKLIAVRTFDAFRKSGDGTHAPIVWLPAEMVAGIIEKCIEIRKQLIDDVWQLTGISDVMRGDTEAEETAAAQGMKSNWGAVRLKERQDELARVARDVTRMCAEVVSSQFQVSTMLECSNMKLPTDQDVAMATMKYQQEMQAWQAQQQAAMMGHNGGPPMGPPPNGQPPSAGSMPSPGNGQPPSNTPSSMGPQAAPAQASPPSSPPPAPQPKPPNLGPTQEQIEAFLRSGIRRRYLIDIETDSTILLDAVNVQRQRTEFIAEAGKFITAMLPVASEQPKALPFIGKLFLFGVRAYPAARELETSAEELVEALEEAANTPRPPDPEQTKLQADLARADADIKKAQIGVQTEQMRAQAEITKAQIELESAKQHHAMDVQKMQLDAQKAQADHQMAIAEHGLKQKTLAQQVQMDERKMAASQSMDLFKDNIARQSMQRENDNTLQMEREKQALKGPPPKRKFNIKRGDDGMAAGFEEV